MKASFSAIADAGEFASDASLGVRYRITGAHPSNPLGTFDGVNRLPKTGRSQFAKSETTRISVFTMNDQCRILVNNE